MDELLETSPSLESRPWNCDTDARYHRNTTGNNQFGGPVVNEHEVPKLREMLVTMLQDNLSREEMLQELLNRGMPMSRTTLYRWLNRLKLGTPRKPIHSRMEMGQAITELLQEDLLSRWGASRVQHKLRRSHGMTDVPINFVREFMLARDAAAVQTRFPGKKRIHKTTLWSSAINQEWSVDGFEKLAEVAGGLYCYAFRDVASRLSFPIYVLPNVRLDVIPPAIFLRVAREVGGIPLRLTTDKGSETGRLCAMMAALRRIFARELDDELLEPFGQIKSIYNITVEKSWRALWESELQAIKVAWDAGVRAGIYHPHIDVEFGLARWIWAQVVQTKLDAYVQERNSAKIRKQPKRALPSGKSPNAFWREPHKYGLDNFLVHIPRDVFDELVEKYTPPGCFQFVSDNMQALAERVYRGLHSPALDVLSAWDVYQEMLDVVRTEYPHVNVNDDEE